MKELHRLKLHKIIQEFFCNYYFHGLKRGDDIEKIKNIYNKREAKVKGFYLNSLNVFNFKIILLLLNS